MGKGKDLVYWNVPATKSLDLAVEDAVRRDMPNTKSDFVRDAVRGKLKEMGFTISATSPTYTTGSARPQKKNVLTRPIGMSLIKICGCSDS